jgi:transposase
MKPEEMFEQLLGLGKAWRVVEARFEASSSTFVLKVEETAAFRPEEGTRAGTPVTCHNYIEPKPIQWRHLNVSDKECVIVCALPRRQRSDDGKVYRVTSPWKGRSKHFTQGFQAFAVTLMLEMLVKRASQILGESDTRMWRLLFAHVKAAYERLSFDTELWVGADKMNRRKGHKYLTVFTDLVANRVLFATPGKDASVWAAFAAELLRHNGHPKAIQHVAIDMSAVYTKGVSNNLGNVQVVSDKFHVIQNVVEACDQVRKAESRADAGKRNRLERTRWMWLKNQVNWMEKETQKWESMALERCVTGMAYQMRLVLQCIDERKDAGDARKLFRKWCAWVHAMRGQTGELQEQMARAARMVEGHLVGILAHWTRGLTTAFMEGLNSLFSAVQRKARGYRTVECMTAMLYLVAGKLTLPC